MKEIDGYILITAVTGRSGRFMHGPNEGRGMGATENFRTNGMKPFETIEDVKKAMIEFKKREDALKVFPKRIEMRVAEDLEEMHAFERMNALITIMFANDNFGVEFYGRSVEGAQRNGYLPGSILETNGFKPFINFHHAMRSVEEIVRQGQSSVRMSTFKLSAVPKNK